MQAVPTRDMKEPGLSTYTMRRSRLLKAASILLPAMVLAACDTINGVERTASLSEMPSLQCVAKVVREMPKIANVDMRNAEGSRPLTLTGIKAPDQVYYFIYRGAEGSHIWADTHVTKRYDGSATFTQDNVRINATPPQEEIDASRPVMRDVEVALERQCVVSPLPLVIHERCVGVRCDPLPSGPA